MSACVRVRVRVRINMIETHDTLADSALDATKSLHELLRIVSPTQLLSNDAIQHMKMLNKKANNAVAAMRRHHKEAEQMAIVRETLLREALHGELLDRQARGARLEERYQALSDTRASESAIEAARRANNSLDQSIAAICSHHHVASNGTYQTQKMAEAAALAAATAAVAAPAAAVAAPAAAL